MPKAAVSVTGVQAGAGTVSVAYSVGIDDGSRFSSSYTVDFTVPASTNLVNLRNRIITQAQQFSGATLASTDIYMFGFL